MTGLERCADCRRICTCYQDCVCSTLDDTGTLRCHDCTDAHDNAGTIERLFPAEGVAKLAAILTGGAP